MPLKDITSKDFLLSVAQGNESGYSLVHKFGSTDSLSNALIPISSAGVYQTPTSAVSLEVVSSDANDTAAGSGAREITIVGLDATWAEQTVTVATSGTSAAAVSGTWLRVYRAYVSSSGTYSSASAGSHAGTITIRVASAGATYAEIPLIDSFPVGQSLISAYTVPLGYTAYMLRQSLSSGVSGTKTTNFYFFQRQNADDVTTPYSGIMRVQNVRAGIQGAIDDKHETAEAYPAKTDMGFMGIASAAGSFNASAEFELLLVAD